MFAESEFWAQGPKIERKGEIVKGIWQFIKAFCKGETPPWAPLSSWQNRKTLYETIPLSQEQSVN